MAGSFEVLTPAECEVMDELAYAMRDMLKGYKGRIASAALANLTALNALEMGMELTEFLTLQGRVYNLHKARIAHFEQATNNEEGQTCRRKNH